MPNLAKFKVDKETITKEDTEAIVKGELQKESKELRKDFITIFGLFAAFLTFTVLQIQALIQTTRMAYIMGASSFFVASSLTFIFALSHLFKEKNNWRDFIRPIFVVILLIFFFSFECFWFATHNNTLWP